MHERMMQGCHSLRTSLLITTAVREQKQPHRRRFRLALGAAVMGALAAGLATTLVSLTALAARAPELVLRSVQEPVVGDGRTVATLQIEIKDAAGPVRQLQVKPGRGKVLAVGAAENGVAEVKYRPPKVTKNDKVVFSVSVSVGGRQVHAKLPLTLVPAAEVATSASAAGTGPDLAPLEPVEPLQPLPSAPGPEGGAGAGAAPAASARSAPSTSAAAAEGGAAAATTVIVAAPAAGGNASTTPAPVSTGRERFILWELSALGIDPQVVRSLSEMVQGEMERLFKGRVLPQPSEPARQAAASCTKELRVCLAEAGQALGADRLIYGVVASVGDAYSLNLRVVDVREQRDLVKANASLSGERDQLLSQIEVLLLELVAPERLTGALALTLDLPGAEVYVDGKRVGTTPLAGPVASLAVGEHSLKVSAPDIEDYFTFFTIYYGKTSSVVVDAARIKVVRSELAAAPRHFGPLVLGVKAGYSSNLRALATPVLSGEILLGLPIITDGLEVGLEASYRWQTRAVTDPVRGESASVAAHLVPVTAKVVYAWPVASVFTLRPAVCVGAVIADERVSSVVTGNAGEVGAHFAAGAELGAEIPVGFGAVALDVGYLYVLPRSDLITGSLGGPVATLGYRFGF